MWDSARTNGRRNPKRSGPHAGGSLNSRIRRRMAQLSSNRVLVLATNTACIECTPMTASNSNCGTSAFALPRIDRCPLLPPFLIVRGAVDRATVGRTDEEAIGPWVRTAGSPESLAWLGQSGSVVDSTHRRSPLSSTCSVQPSQVQGRCVVELSRAVWRCVRWRTHIGLRAASPRVPPHVVESRSSAEPPPGGIAG
jgi:hypothetical protein